MTCSSRNTDFLHDLIERTKVAIEEAFAAEAQFLQDGAVSSYTFDTGQTKQTVTAANITEFRKYIDSLLNRLATLEQRAGCYGGLISRPGW